MSASLAYYDTYRSDAAAGQPHAGAARLLRRPHLPPRRSRWRVPHRVDRGDRGTDAGEQQTVMTNARSDSCRRRARFPLARRARSPPRSRASSRFARPRPARFTSAAASSTSPRTWPTASAADRHRDGDGRLSDRRAGRRAGAGHGRDAVLQDVRARRRARSEHGDRLQRSRASACAARSSSTTAATRRPRSSSPATSTGTTIFGARRALVPQRRHFRVALRDDCRSSSSRGCRRRKASGAVVSFDLNYREKLWSAAGGADARARRPRPHRRTRRRAGRERGGPSEGARDPRSGSRGQHVGTGSRAPSSR